MRMLKRAEKGREEVEKKGKTNIARCERLNEYIYIYINIVVVFR